MRDPVQPRAQRARRSDAQRSGAPEEDQEGGLEGVLGRVLVAEHLPADGENHRPMAGQNRLERGLGRLIPLVRASLEQVAVGQPDGTPCAEETPEVPLEVSRRCARHDLPSAQESTVPIFLFPTCGRRNTPFSSHRSGVAFASRTKKSNPPANSRTELSATFRIHQQSRRGSAVGVGPEIGSSGSLLGARRHPVANFLANERPVGASKGM